jgi:hypothetical protein
MDPLYREAMEEYMPKNLSYRDLLHKVASAQYRFARLPADMVDSFRAIYYPEAEDHVVAARDYRDRDMNGNPLIDMKELYEFSCEIMQRGYTDVLDLSLVPETLEKYLIPALKAKATVYFPRYSVLNNERPDFPEGDYTPHSGTSFTAFLFDKMFDSVPLVFRFMTTRPHKYDVPDEEKVYIAEKVKKQAVFVSEVIGAEVRVKRMLYPLSLHVEADSPLQAFYFNLLDFSARLHGTC